VSEAELLDDPFELHLRRDTRAGAAVDVLVFDAGRPERAAAIGERLAGLVRSKGREAGFAVIPSRAELGRGRAMAEVLSRTGRPLVLVTDAVEDWTDAHLAPLLEAIDRADHVVGRREVGPMTAAWRWLRKWPRIWLYAVPVHDPNSPVRLHRREALAAIPLQAESDFLDLEILAKATFLGQLIDEVPVPPLAGDDEGRNGALRRHDAAELFRHPVFAFSAPIRPGVEIVAPQAPAPEVIEPAEAR